MNESGLIDPATCRTCGRCCQYFEIGYQRDSSEFFLSEIARFQALKGLGDALTIRDEPDTIWLRFNIPCKYLVEESGIFSCSVYDSSERPLMCQRFPYPDSTPEDCPHMGVPGESS